MNKYGTKIVNYLDQSSNIDIRNKINTSHPFIKQIMDLINSINYNLSYNKTTTKIKKIHSNKYPLFYNVYYNTYPVFSDFYQWFIVNQQTTVSHPKNEYYDLIFNPCSSRQELHDLLYNNSFISLDVLHYFEITDVFNVKVNDVKFDLDLYIAQSDESKIDYFISKITKILNIMYEINNVIIKNPNKKIIVKVLLTKQRKEIIDDLIPVLSPININSGSSIREKLVCVWREEELEKVLIHEIQHYYGCDFYSDCDEYYYVKKILDEYFNVDGRDMVNESYNETLAHIIHMCFINKEINLDIQRIYEIEMKFLFLQTAKIIKYFGGKDFNQLFRSHSKFISLKQTTSVLSYYIIKTIMMFNINQTLDLILKFDMKCNNKNKDNIKSFGDFLKQLLSDKTEINNLSYYVNYFINKLDSLDDCFVKRTLRMTAISV